MARGKINITFLTLRNYKITLAMLIFLYIGTYRSIDMLEIYHYTTKKTVTGTFKNSLGGGHIF